MKYVVNVVTKEITPYVIEADNEWDAMEKVADGQGYIHMSGSQQIIDEPLDWEVIECDGLYAEELWTEWV